MVDGGFLPSVGIDVLLFFLMRGYLMTPMRMAGWIDDAGVVATVGQHKSHVCIGQHLNF